MEMVNTQTITRDEAIARMSYIITLLEEGLYDEAEARDNYIIENNLPHKLSTGYE